MDRIDIHMQGPRVEFQKLRDMRSGESLAEVRKMLDEPILLVFGMLMFTLSWSAIMTFIEPVTADSWGVSLLSSLILFLMFYPPSRLVFVVEECLVKQSPLNRVMMIVFFLLAMLGALREVPGLF